MPRKIPRFLSKEEMKALMDVAKKDSPRNYMTLRMLCFLGLRNSEIRKLTVEDVDLMKQQVFVSQGKGKKDRIVAVPGMKPFLEELDKWTAENDKFFDLSARQLQRIVKAYAVKAGIRRPLEIHPHTLRHSYATYLQDKTDNILFVKEQMGHSKVATTEIYVHMAMEARKKKTDQAFSDW